MDIKTITYCKNHVSTATDAQVNSAVASYISAQGINPGTMSYNSNSIYSDGSIGAAVIDIENSLDDKQDKLVAGAGISIASDGKTISTTILSDAYTITVNLSTSNGDVFESVVSLYSTTTGMLVDQASCSGTSVTFSKPSGFAYTIKFSTPSGYANLSDETGVLSSNIIITKVFKSRVVYGFHINGSESDPSNMVTYLEDAVGMTPAYMNYTSGVFNWGSWNNAFFIPRPCMLKSNGTVDYYLNQSDYKQKEDGTDSDVSNTSYDGNAMMEWGQSGSKIWLKVVPDTSDSHSANVYIANSQVDSDYHAYSFINSNGDIVNHFYTPIYIGSMINSKLRSISGQATDQSKSGTDEINAAKENGSGWNTEFNCDVVLINYLLILMCKSTDMQSAFGYGRCGYSDATSGTALSGLMDNKGMFWGQNVYDGSEIGVKVFGMEHWWGDQWRRFLGLLNVNGNIKYKLCYGRSDGSTADDYNTDGTGYISSGIKLSGTNGGYISQMTFSSDGSMNISASNGSSSTYYCDGLYYDNTQIDYPGRGGSYGTKLIAGPFALNLNATIASGNKTLVAAPAYKPLS